MDGRLADLTAVILAGGRGTRLRSVVPDRQKVVALVRGRPFLAFLLDQLGSWGLTRAVLCVGHRGEQVREVIGDTHGAIRLTYSQEPEPLGTAGAIRLALPHLDLPRGASDTLLALNGDSYCQADLEAFWQHHRETSADATLLLARVPDTARFGRVTLDPHGKVGGFEEKGAASGPGWINAGLYLLSHSFVAALPAGTPVSMEREVFPRSIGGAFYGFRGGTRFLDIGTPRSYEEAERFFAGEGDACRSDDM